LNKKLNKQVREVKAKNDKLNQISDQLRRKQDELLVLTGGSDIKTKEILHSAVRDIGRPRFALIFGNGAYGSDGPLENPENDALDVSARLLQACNFQDVRTLTNQNYDEMKSAINSFIKLVNSPEMLQNGRVVFFYFSGHGCESGGNQKLCPVKTPQNWLVGKLFGNKYIDLNEVIRSLDPTNAECQRKTGLKGCELVVRNTNIFVVDACRAESDKAELYKKPSDAPPSTLIMFACPSGKCSFDGPRGKNGEFTSFFLLSFQFGIQMSLHELIEKTKALAYSNPEGCHPIVYDTTSQDFTFQYNPAFRLQVQKIREDILSKEGGNIWNTMGKFVNDIWNSWFGSSN